MDSPVEQLHRFYFDAVFVPGALSFALVVMLAIVRKKRPDISIGWIFGIFAIGFLVFTCVPHAWQILFPEPCVFQFSSPTNMCNFGPSVRLQAGMFAGMLGALSALLTLKVGLTVRRKLKK
ncbi:hypothetical protein BK636_02190 [Pseudomonas chlororaphis]|uniref:hypothetical protein n=1 Tax=Pseudomonas chlororaphis TaxID=587753 RepID=UPI000F46C48E|nr:hypothetical protein [Pseudomonas chlororaphis]ROL94182.1 hypothetical protein BK636_02190 [Pseudomonas chlororaphis]